MASYNPGKYERTKPFAKSRDVFFEWKNLQPLKFLMSQGFSDFGERAFTSLRLLKLKIRFPRGSGGSSPFTSTIAEKARIGLFCFANDEMPADRPLFLQLTGTDNRR